MANLVICIKCAQEKPRSDFHKNKHNKNGLQSYCKICWKDYINSTKHLYRFKYKYQAIPYKPTDPRYSDTHPEQWKEYYSEYMRKYKSDDMRRVRSILCTVVCRLRIKKLFNGPKSKDKCSCCKKKEDLMVYFNDDFVKSNITIRSSKEDIIKNIIWMCRKCVIKKREEAKPKTDF